MNFINSKKKKVKSTYNNDKINYKSSKKKKRKKIIDLEYLKRERPSTTIKSIPYECFEKNDITRLGKELFSQTFEFSDINYHTAREEEQEHYFLEYCSILNSFDSTTKLQVTIVNEDMDVNEFKNKIFSKLRNDELDVYREEYNTMLNLRLSEGSSNLVQSKYITCTIEAKSVDIARNKFNRIFGALETHFKKLDSTLKIVSNVEKTELLKNIYRSRNINIYPERLNFKSSEEKSSIAPTYMEFKPNYFIMDNKFCKTLYLRDIPSSLSDRLITEITELEFKTLLSINIECVEQDKAQQIVRRQITNMESNQYDKEEKAMKNFRPYIANRKLKESLEEAEKLLDDLNKRNQKMFLLNIVVTIFGDTLEELDLNTESLMSVARRSVCNLATLNYQQEVGFNSCLPLGNCNLKARRTLTTESTSVFMPFNVKEVASENGNYYGVNSISSKVIILNRKKLKNANGWILGDSGSGKSFTAKREIAGSILNTDDDVIMLDPSNEYTYLTRMLGGEVIEISPQSKNYINPFDMNESYAGSDDPITLKSDYILSLCDSIIGGEGGLSPRAKTIIDRCVRNVYREYVQDFNKDKTPTLTDFYNELLKQKEPEAEDIAISLEIYVKGSLSVFSNKTNIDSNNRILCFDTSGLGKSLKTFGLLVALDNIWNRVIENNKKGKATWIYIDEIHMFLKNDYARNFLQELYKIIRKYGGIPTGITQDIDDILKNEEAVTMLNNSQFIVMLGQAKLNVKRIQDVFELSDTQAGYISNAEKGSGLVYYGGSIVPFKDNFPKDLKLYDIFDTTPESSKSA